MREGVTSSPGITSPRESFGLNALHICELLRATLKGSVPAEGEMTP
jgi:hypothetical protein